MAEYNVQYLDLQRRIATLKAKLEFDPSLAEAYSDLDSIAKMLDEKYSEGRYLDDIEYDIEQLEKK